jgi:multicomponent K+:H+ antiporter subunit F
MIDIALAIAAALVGLAVCLALVRLAVGPSAPDRVLALDTLSYDAIALLILADIHFGHQAYFAPALVIAALGFVSTVALSMYLLRGEVIE